MASSSHPVIDFKVAITEDVAEIDLALSVLNGLRNVNLARLAVLQEAEKRA
jgi:hypothetical protein